MLDKTKYRVYQYERLNAGIHGRKWQKRSGEKVTRQDAEPNMEKLPVGSMIIVGVPK